MLRAQRKTQWLERKASYHELKLDCGRPRTGRGHDGGKATARNRRQWASESDLKVGPTRAVRTTDAPGIVLRDWEAGRGCVNGGGADLLCPDEHPYARAILPSLLPWSKSRCACIPWRGIALTLGLSLTIAWWGRMASSEVADGYRVDGRGSAARGRGLCSRACIRSDLHGSLAKMPVRSWGAGHKREASQSSGTQMWYNY
jgi:hypothetical protein